MFQYEHVMIEELLKTFIGVINTQLFESIELREKIHQLILQKQKTYIEDFKTGNIEYSNEILSFRFNIERYIDTLDQPGEHTEIDLINYK